MGPTSFFYIYMMVTVIARNFKFGIQIDGNVY